jgi:arabinoxylan arabinofuranohydrolase
LTNGRSYTTSVWARAQTGTATAKVTLQVTANGSTSYITLAPSTGINASGWSSASLYVETASETSGFYIDDASFK